MPHQYIEKVLPFSVDQLFDLVCDIESYPIFLPWCEGARILERQEDGVVLAELRVNFKAFRGKYTSRVFMDRKDREISVESVQGPFEHLYNGWKFFTQKEGTRVEFDIDFKMRSIVLEKLIHGMFDAALQKMMKAFESRAAELYGPTYG